MHEGTRGVGAGGTFPLCCWPCIFPAALQRSGLAAEQVTYLPAAANRLPVCYGVPWSPQTHCLPLSLSALSRPCGWWLQHLRIPWVFRSRLQPLTPGLPHQSPGEPRAEPAGPGRAKGPAVSQGNWVVLGTCKELYCDLPWLRGDSRTGDIR